MELLTLLSVLALAILSLAAPSTQKSVHTRAQSLSDEYLTAHNDIRSSFGASPLQWSTTLAEQAQDWANGCQLANSGGQFGENIAAGGGDFTPTAAVQTFASDMSDYDPQHPSYNHFTQIVWKSTTEVGCAVAQCYEIFGPEYGPASYHVCLYNPAGNVVGQAPQNVQV